jgi:hypothetical protein
MLNCRKILLSSGAFILVAGSGALLMAAPSATAPAPKELAKSTPAADQAWVTTVSTTRQRSDVSRDSRPNKPAAAPRAGQSAPHPERAAAIEARVPLILGVTY